MRGWGKMVDFSFQMLGYSACLSKQVRRKSFRYLHQDQYIEGKSAKRRYRNIIIFHSVRFYSMNEIGHFYGKTMI